MSGPAPAASLRPITADDYVAACRLDVRPDQRQYVAPNARSLADMHFRPHWESHGVHAGGAMVGFVLLGVSPEDGRWWIQRFMIGADHQGKGLGRAAILETLRVLREERGAREVFLSFVPANAAARRLYESVGFRDTGERDPEGEIVCRWAPGGS